MDFADVAGYFDEDPVRDGYTDELLFYCHTTPHDDHTSSGATARRRTMTTEDGTSAPARGVVSVYGSAWLVSNSHPDGFQGELVRRSYGLKQSTGVMACMSPADACTGSAFVTTFHAHREYFRDNQNARTESEWDVMWNIFVAGSEQLRKGYFLRQGSTLYRIRAHYPTVEGLQIAEADQLDTDALQDVTFTSNGTLDLVTDTYPTISIVAAVIQTDVTKFYRFRTAAESNHMPGDRAVFVPKSMLTPHVGGEFTMLEEIWRIVSVVPEHDCWVLHVRLA